MTFDLSSLLPVFRAFDLAYLLAFFLSVFGITWGRAVNTLIGSLRLSSGSEHLDCELAVGDVTREKEKKEESPNKNLTILA